MSSGVHHFIRQGGMGVSWWCQWVVAMSWLNASVGVR